MYPFRTQRPRAGFAGTDEIPANGPKADARTRTADPFITSEGRVRDARPLGGTSGHVLAGNGAVLQPTHWTRLPARVRACVPVLYPSGPVFRVRELLEKRVPEDPNVRIGCPASHRPEKIESYVEIGKQEGAELLIGGERSHLGGELEDGYYVVRAPYRARHHSRFAALGSVLGARPFDQPVAPVSNSTGSSPRSPTTRSAPRSHRARPSP